MSNHCQQLYDVFIGALLCRIVTSQFHEVLSDWSADLYTEIHQAITRYSASSKPTIAIEKVNNGANQVIANFGTSSAGSVFI